MDRPAVGQRQKTFDSAILTLERGAARWKQAGALPEGLAYGATVALESSLVIIGGQTAAGFSSKVWVLRPDKNGIRTESATSLPSPLANASAAILDNRVYVMDGQTDPAASALNQVRSIPLAALPANRGQWRDEPPIPGRPRFFPQAASCGDRIFLAGGTDLVGQPPTRLFLSDAWTFSPSTGWKAIAPLPRPAQAGIGLCEAELGDHHPGFSREVFRYDAARNSWVPAGQLPGSFVTTSAAR